MLYDFFRALDFYPVVFDATDRWGTPIYHTNVMMSIADEYAIIVQDTIKDRSQRYQVLQSFLKSRKEIVFISLEQMEYFAANALQVKSTGGQRFLVMSETGYRSLSKGQRKQIEKFNPILHTPLDTIEQNGGGSARCMIAEIFLPLRHGGIEKP